MKHLYQLFSAVLISLLASSTHAGEEMSAETLLEQINSNRAPLILDTRSAYEFRHGHIPGAKHFPFWLSYARADDLKLAKNQPIVVYCAHGPRASITKHALNLSGFTNVLMLDGHMSGWRKAGLPIEHQKTPD